MRVLATVLAMLTGMAATGACVLATLALHQPLLTVGCGCLAGAAFTAVTTLMDPPVVEPVSRPVVLS